MSLKSTLPTHREESEDVTIQNITHNPSRQVSHVTGLGLGLDEAHAEDEEEVEDAYEAPETQNLLPPLPFHDSSLSASISRSDSVDPMLTVELSETPLSSPVRNFTKNSSFTLSPVTLHSHIPKSNSSPMNSIDSLQSPKSIKSSKSKETAVNDVLNYSPAINIQERFEVCLDMPIINESKAPKTIQEKIKLYEDVQKTEIIEFDKTLKNLKNSGWMSEKEILQLENAKFDNFNKWETKIKDLKSTVRKAPSVNSLQHLGNRSSLSDGARGHDDYFSSQRSRSPASANNDLHITSPTLQNLEKKFSNLGL
jgi:hypothetical protein